MICKSICFKNNILYDNKEFGYFVKNSQTFYYRLKSVEYAKRRKHKTTRYAGEEIKVVQKKHRSNIIEVVRATIRKDGVKWLKKV